MRRVGLIIAFASISACSKEQLHEVHLRSVLDEASKNELRPTAKLRERALLVSGVIERTGIKKQNEAKQTGTLAPFGYWETETYRVRAQYPYAILAPKEGGAGRALCFFEAEDLDSVVELKVGELVTFRAKLQEFLKNNGQEVMVLACSMMRRSN